MTNTIDIDINDLKLDGQAAITDSGKTYLVYASDDKGTEYVVIWDVILDTREIEGVVEDEDMCNWDDYRVILLDDYDSTAENCTCCPCYY